jgi:hypothetical protein
MEGPPPSDPGASCSIYDTLYMYKSLLEKTALQNFTSQVKFIKVVPVCKVNFVLTLQKCKGVKLTFTTAKIQSNITFHL